MVVFNARLQFFVPQRHDVEVHLHGEMVIQPEQRIVVGIELEELAWKLVTLGGFRDRNTTETGNIAKTGGVDEG